MTCNQSQTELMNLAARGTKLSGALADHVSTCSECRKAWDDLVLAASALATLPRERAPVRAVQTVRRQVLGELQAEANRRRVQLGLAVGFGLLSAAVSLAVLGVRIDLAGRSAWAIAAGGLAWVAMFVVAFWVLLKPRSGLEDLRGLIVSGLGAMAIFLVADQFLPLTKVVQFCYASSWAREHLGLLGVQGAFFLVGTIYALVPLFLLSVATGKRYRSGPLKGGLIAGGMFFFLLAPAIFIQCSAFTAGALLGWLGGAVIGSTVGGVAGYWLYRHTQAGRV